MDLFDPMDREAKVAGGFIHRAKSVMTWVGRMRNIKKYIFRGLVVLIVMLLTLSMIRGGCSGDDPAPQQVATIDTVVVYREALQVDTVKITIRKGDCSPHLNIGGGETVRWDPDTVVAYQLCYGADSFITFPAEPNPRKQVPPPNSFSFRILDTEETDSASITLRHWKR